MVEFLVGSITNFGHVNPIPLGTISDLAHVIAHEHESAPTRPFQVLDGGRIGYVLRIKSGPLVLDLDLEAIGSHRVVNMNLLGWIEVIAVLDGVDERFFQRESHREDVPIREVVGAQSGLDGLLNGCRIHGIAAQDDVRSNCRLTGHGKNGSKDWRIARPGGLEHLQTFLLVVLDGEDLVETGDLEDFTNIGVDIAEDKLTPGALDLLVQGYELAQRCA